MVPVNYVNYQQVLSTVPTLRASLISIFSPSRVGSVEAGFDRVNAALALLYFAL